MEPVISVVIPTYNRGPAIKDTVESVLRQDIAPESVEVIIVDDGSTDDTWDALQSLFEGHPRIRLFRIENGGVAGARNFGLDKARGEFIAYLDHDDIWLPPKLRLQLEKMTKSPRTGVVYCHWLSVDQSGNEMPPIIQFQRHWWWRPAQGKVFPWVMLPHPFEFLRNPIISMSVPLIRTQALRDIGGFDAELVPADDWDVWIRLSQRMRFVYVNKILVHYVHHPLQQHKKNFLQEGYISWLKICAKHPVSWRSHPWVKWKQWLIQRYCRAFMMYPDAKDAVCKGDYLDLIRLTLRAARWRPDVLITRRWRGLWLRALKGQKEPF